MVVETGRELFEHELRDIYDAEHKLVRALERMAKKVSDQKLAQSFAEHREVTRGQIERLEEVFEQLERKPRRSTCAGINGLIEEFNKFVSEDKPSDPVLNVFATGAALKVEHYEIVAYSSLINLAQQLGLGDATTLLQENLSEEQETAHDLETMSHQLGDQLALASSDMQ